MCRFYNISLIIIHLFVFQNVVLGLNSSEDEIYDELLQGNWQKIVSSYKVNKIDREIYLFLMGRQYIKQQKYQLAQDSFKHSECINSNFPFSYFGFGLVCESNKKYDEAIDYFNKAIQKENRYIEAYFMKGLIFVEEKKDSSRALVEFQKIIKLNPQHFDALLYIGLILYPKDIAKAENIVKAKEAEYYFLEAFKINPNSLICNKYLKRVNMNLGHDRKAIMYLENIKKITPNDGEVVSDYPILERRILLSDSANLIVKEGEKFIEINEYNRAVEKAEEALNVFPNYPDAVKLLNSVKYNKLLQVAKSYYNRGNSFYKIDEFGAAVKNFKAANDSFNLAFNYAFSDSLQRVIKENLKKNSEMITKAETLFGECQNLYFEASTLITCGDYERALDNLKSAYNICSKDNKIKNRLIETSCQLALIYKVSAPKKAKAYIQDILEIDKNHKKTLELHEEIQSVESKLYSEMWKVNSHCGSGNYQDAKDLLEEISQNFPNYIDSVLFKIIKEDIELLEKKEQDLNFWERWKKLLGLDNGQ